MFCIGPLSHLSKIASEYEVVLKKSKSRTACKHLQLKLQLQEEQKQKMKNIGVLYYTLDLLCFRSKPLIWFREKLVRVQRVVQRRCYIQQSYYCCHQSLVLVPSKIYITLSFVVLFVLSLTTKPTFCGVPNFLGKIHIINYFYIIINMWIIWYSVIKSLKNYLTKLVYNFMIIKK